MFKITTQFENELKDKMLRAKKGANIILPGLIRCWRNMVGLKQQSV